LSLFLLTGRIIIKRKYFYEFFCLRENGENLLHSALAMAITRCCRFNKNILKAGTNRDERIELYVNVDESPQWQACWPNADFTAGILLCKQRIPRIRGPPRGPNNWRMSWARAINQMLVYTRVYICLANVQMSRKFARSSRMPCWRRGVPGTG